MAADGSFNSVQSHDGETGRKSPFYVHQDDAAALKSCEAFQVIHRSLVAEYKSMSASALLEIIGVMLTGCT